MYPQPMTEDQLARIHWEGLMAVDEQTQENLDILCKALNQMPDVNWAPEDGVPLLAACIEMSWVEGMQACLDKGASIEIALSNFISSDRTIDKGVINPRAIGVLLQHGWVPESGDIVTWAFVHPLRDLLALTEHGLDLTVKDDQGWQTVDYLVQHDMGVGGHSPHLASTEEDRINFYLYVHRKGCDMKAYIPRYERSEQKAWIVAQQQAQSMIERKALESVIDATQASPSKPKVM